MKKWAGLVFVLVTAAIAGASWAGEYPDNPDRRTSLGLSLGLGGGSGEATVLSGGATASQNVSEGFADLTIDMRIPVSTHLTLSGALSLLGVSSEADETFFLAGQEVEGSGMAIRLGVRYFFGP